MVYIMYILTEVMGSLMISQVGLPKIGSREREDQGSVVG